MPSISAPIDTGVFATGALGPMNNAEALVGGLAQVGMLGGHYYTQALRDPAGYGQVLAGSTTTDIVVDRAVDLLDCVCEPHKLTIMLPNATLETRYILAACGTTGGGSVLTVEVPFSIAPAPSATWILTDGVETGSGHVVSGTVSSVTLDSSVPLDICGSYTLTVFKPDGTGVEAQDTLTDCGDHITVDLEKDLAVAPDPGWIWTLRDAPVGWLNGSVVFVGVQCTGVLGGATALGNPADVAVFGIAIVSQLGTVIVSITISAPVPGVSATGAVGAIGFRQDTFASVTGVSSGGAVGSVSVQVGQFVSVTGRSATGQVGSVAVKVDITASVTGLRAFALPGVVVVEVEGRFPVFGLFASANLGLVAVRLDPNIAVTGAQSVAALGDVIAITSQDDGAVLSGFASAGTHGIVDAVGDHPVFVIGLHSDGQVGSTDGGQLSVGEPRGVHATGILGTVAVRATTERKRVLHVERASKRNALRVARSNDGLPLPGTVATRLASATPLGLFAPGVLGAVTVVIAAVTPTVEGVSGALSHGATLTVSGSGFGAKATAAPVVWDDASGTDMLAKWSGVWPTGALDPSHDLAYQLPIRGVPLPHAHISQYIAGCGIGGDATTGENVLMWKSRSIASYPAYSYASWYQRADDAWVFFGDDNYKVWDFSASAEPFDPNNWYIEYNPTASSPSAVPSWHLNDDAFPLGLNGITGDWWGDVAVNPMSGVWTKIELEIRFDPTSSGYIKLRENGVLRINYSGRTDGLPGSVRSEAIGGYQRAHNANAWRYFADMYVDHTLARVVLANNATLALATVIEPQVPTAWSAGSITVNVNLGRFSAGAAYLFIVDAAGNASAGYPVTVS